jgi:putative DNA primase/helicase
LMAEGRDSDEWRKRITSVLLTGTPVIIFDNLNARLSSSSVSAAITAQYWEDRILGASEDVQIPIKALWIATGNNPSLGSDIARRTVRIRLDSKQEQPWLRTGFLHPDLRLWVQEHRADIVWACLTIIRRWLAKGRPQPKNAPKLGSFEAWSEVMGGILHSAHVEGFLGNIKEFYEKSDAEGAAWRSFVNAWWVRFGASEVPVSELFPLAEHVDLGKGNERSQRIKLGLWMAGAVDRHYGELVVKRGAEVDGVQRWRLESAETQEGYV